MTNIDLKIIYRPSVYLATSTRLHEEEVEQFVRVECGADGWDWRTDLARDEPDQPPEVAGRLCYNSYAKPRPGGSPAYISHILESGHGSVLEHSSFGFIIGGVSRSLTHELIRHRAGCGYSELSQRFVDCTDVAFVAPPAILRAEDFYQNYCTGAEAGGSPHCQEWADWESSCRQSLDAYARLSASLAESAPAELSGTDRRKWARQAARSVLPSCAETRIMMTANLRAWRTVLEQRGAPHADAEIRRLAVAIYMVLRMEAPLVFNDFELTKLPDGTEGLSAKYRKV